MARHIKKISNLNQISVAMIFWIFFPNSLAEIEHFWTKICLFLNQSNMPQIRKQRLNRLDLISINL